MAFLLPFVLVLPCSLRTNGAKVKNGEDVFVCVPCSVELVKLCMISFVYFVQLEVSCLFVPDSFVCVMVTVCEQRGSLE